MRRFLILFAIGISLLCGCSGENKGFGNIVGVVTVKDSGIKAVGVTVNLCGTDLYMSTIETTQTDKEGYFEFNNIPSAIYILRAYVDGEGQDTVHPVRISNGKTEKVDFDVDTVPFEQDEESTQWIELPAAGIAVQTKDVGKNTWESINLMCKNSIVGDYTDWRLPDKDELMILYSNKNNIGGFAADKYWSRDSYYTVDFANGTLNGIGGYNKYSYRGRCVRTISSGNN